MQEREQKASPGHNTRQATVADLIMPTAMLQRRVNQVIFDQFFPGLWIKFLNLNVKKIDEVYGVYKWFMESLEKLAEMVKVSDFLTGDLLDIEGFSSQHVWLNHVHGEDHLGTSQTAMLKAVNDPHVGSYGGQFGEVLAGKSPLVFTVNTNAVLGVTLDYIPYTDYLWLYLTVGAFVVQAEPERYKVKECEAIDCKMLFIPSKHSPKQRYHTKTCRNRMYMRRERQSEKT